MFKRNKFRLLDQAGDASGGGGGEAVQVPSEAPAPASVPAPAPADSLLKTGANDSGTSTAFIPEKFQVKKEDGSLDIESSARKTAEAYGELEKRLGAAPVIPKAASEYKVEVPDNLKEAIDVATDPGIKGFLGGALAQGMTQAQVDFVMGQYFTMAPQLVAGAGQLDATAATAELKKVWATDEDFSRNVKNAYTGATAVAQMAGIDISEIMDGPLGNSPQFLRLMAAVGPEFKEDTGVSGSRIVAESDINALLVSPAYTDPKHPDHGKVSKQVQSYYQRKYGNDAAA